MEFLHILADTTANATNSGLNLGLMAIGAAIAVLCGMASSFGEAKICVAAIEGMTRNPEMQKKLNSTMILAVALDESCAIYSLVVAILIIFVLGGKIA